MQRSFIPTAQQPFFVPKTALWRQYPRFRKTQRSIYAEAKQINEDRAAAEEAFEDAAEEETVEETTEETVETAEEE